MREAVTRKYDDRKGIKSLTRALEVLSCFTTQQPEWGISEVADYLGMFKSAAHRYLQAFEDAGYVERTSDHRYRLGARALELGNVYRFQAPLVAAADEPMRALSVETGCVAHLAQLNGRDALELLRAPTRAENNPVRPPVLRKPAHASSVGKVLLALSGDAAIDRYIGFRPSLKRYTQHTIVQPDELRAHLRQVAEQNFATDRQEECLGRFCVAVPVCGDGGRVAAAISLSSSSDQFQEPPLFLSRLAALRRAARSIETHLCSTKTQPSSANSAI
jgi:DNA-binding IclR family transcriptional regulator